LESGIRAQFSEVDARWWNARNYKNFLQFALFTALPKMKLPQFQNMRVSKWNQGLQQLLNEKKYDVLFIYSGQGVLPETLKAARAKGMKVVLRMWDALSFMPHVEALLPYVDLFFTFEQTDVAGVAARHPHLHAEYMCLFADPAVFYPIDNPNRDIDLIFAGAARSGRTELLQEVAKFCANRGYVFRVFGDRFFHKKYRPGQQKIFEKKFPDLAKVVQPGVPLAKVNDLYAKAKICLNQQISEQVGLPLRTFECMGAGLCQLTNRPGTLDLHFKDGNELSVFDSTEELFQKLDWLMKNPDERLAMAKRGYDAIQRGYLLEHRIATIVNHPALKKGTKPK
jgi:hypothetical protein